MATRNQALEEVIQAVALWRDDEGPDMAASSFIQIIEDALDNNGVVLPLVVYKEGEEKPSFLYVDQLPESDTTRLWQKSNLAMDNAAARGDFTVYQAERVKNVKLVRLLMMDATYVED